MSDTFEKEETKVEKQEDALDLSEAQLNEPAADQTIVLTKAVEADDVSGSELENVAGGSTPAQEEFAHELGHTLGLSSRR